MRRRPLDAGLPVPAAFGTLATGDLSLRSGTERALVLDHRDRLARAVGGSGAALAVPEQVHGAGVAVVDRAPATGVDVPAVDAVVTRVPGIALLVLAADCMPVLLADPAAGVVGAAHAGRPGLVAGVLPATVAAMRELGAVDVVATVGPCIGGCCYELPQPLADAVAAVVPEVRSTTRWGTPSIDLRAGADAVLAAAGVTTVRHVGGCTHEQPDLLWSFRRDGTRARHGGVVTAG